MDRVLILWIRNEWSHSRVLLFPGSSQLRLDPPPTVHVNLRTLHSSEDFGTGREVKGSGVTGIVRNKRPFQLVHQVARS